MCALLTGDKETFRIWELTSNVWTIVLLLSDKDLYDRKQISIS
jgi:hypothetical protein